MISLLIAQAASGLLAMELQPEDIGTLNFPLTTFRCQAVGDGGLYLVRAEHNEMANSLVIVPTSDSLPGFDGSFNDVAMMSSSEQLVVRMSASSNENEDQAKFAMRLRDTGTDGQFSLDTSSGTFVANCTRVPNQPKAAT